ncbi:MAG: DUF255 domain-containing protein [Cyclobacteriaceae bacterium]|nr:DUF255 domain-containing protein [Cyclobacteriaceae bacterium]
MKSFVIILALVVVFMFVRATVYNHYSIDESKGINFFEGTWQEALERAKMENKLIFLDAYASWCGPCKMMKKKVFADTKAGDFFNEYFINVKMDMENGEGPTLANRFGVKAYPSLYFIDHKEKVKKYAVGYHNKRQLLKLGETVMEN